MVRRRQRKGLRCQERDGLRAASWSHCMKGHRRELQQSGCSDWINCLARTLACFDYNYYDVFSEEEYVKGGIVRSFLLYLARKVKKEIEHLTGNEKVFLKYFGQNELVCRLYGEVTTSWWCLQMKQRTSPCIVGFCFICKHRNGRGKSRLFELKIGKHVRSQCWEYLQMSFILNVMKSKLIEYTWERRTGNQSFMTLRQWRRTILNRSNVFVDWMEISFSKIFLAYHCAFSQHSCKHSKSFAKWLTL